MNMAEVNDWKFTLGNTLPVGLWPTKVPKMKAPAEPEPQPLKAPAGLVEVSGASYMKAGKQLDAYSWQAVEAIIEGNVAKAVWKTSKPVTFGGVFHTAKALALLDEIEPATMKLSVAIRLGSNGMRQVRGKWGDGFASGCAMTAALVGASRLAEVFALGGGVDKVWPNVPPTLFADVMNRNDASSDTFAQIADWVEARGY